MLVPSAWLPKAKMGRIHVHWTGGAYKANAIDLKSYHVLIEGDGKVVRGKPSIAANEAPGKAGMAYHTLNANTGAIGVSMCCMGGKDVQEEPFRAGKWPLTREQWGAMIQVVAELAHAYQVPVTAKTILTHAEVQPRLGIRQRNKWDITRLAFDRTVRGYNAVGEKMRAEVMLALKKLSTAPKVITVPPIEPVPMATVTRIPLVAPAQDRPAWAVACFRKLGWPRTAAVALVGNAQQEVYLDLRLGAKGDPHLPGGSIGMFQWNNGPKGQYHRARDFLAWCKREGFDPLNLEANVRYADLELRGLLGPGANSERTWGNLLLSAPTVYSACRWAISYCRPQGWSALNPQAGHGWANRLANAIALDKRLP